MTRIIIAAAGEGIRWNNFRNTPKHLAIVEGERLIDRAYKQFRDFSDDIVIISRDGRYQVGDAKIKAPLEGNWFDFGKIYSSNHLWSDERTIIVFGDVYFTDEAIQTIMSNSDPYKFFMRKGPSKYTGKGHKEIFAFAFDGSMNEKIKKHINELVDMKQGGAGAWRLYLHMHNIKHERDYFKDDGHIEINDWTDDFDYPKDILQWEKMRLKFGAK